jgi:hypothetical protein
MNRKIYLSLIALMLALTAIALAGRQAEQKALAAPAGHALLGQLPASDFVVYIDTQRAMTDVLPQLLAERPEQRARLESHLNKFTNEFGFDPRSLDAVAVGMNLSSSRRADDFAFLARGRFDANAAIDAMFAGAIKESKGRVEKQTLQHEGATIYVMAEAKRVVLSDGQPDGIQAKPLEESLADDRRFAAAALDSNTIAFGSVKNVRATIDAGAGRNRVDDELVQLATRNANAVVGFSGKVTPALASTLRLGNNQQANDSIAAIRQVYGSFNANGSDAEASINIRTDAAEQAQKLSSTLNALKFMAKLGSAQAPEGKRKSFEAMLQDLKIEQVGNEVQINLKLAQTDLAPFAPRF